MSALAEEPRAARAAAESPAVRMRNVRVRRLSTSGMIWTVVLTVLLAGIVALNVTALRTTIEIGRINGQVRQLQQENRTLQSQLAQNSSATRIARLARRYGMQQKLPATQNFLTLPTHTQAPAAP